MRRGPSRENSHSMTLPARVPTNTGFKTVQAAVVDMLRALILTGEISPGTRLLQNELAEHFKISTTPVREALRQLTAEGLLHGDAHRGVRVHATTLEDLDQIYELRMPLESLEMTYTVPNATPDDLRQLAELLSVMERETDTSAWLMLNAAFHERLSEIADRPRIAEILRNLRHLSAIYVAASIQAVPDRIAASDEEHRAVHDAIRRRDVNGAQSAILEHLRRSRELAAVAIGVPAAVGPQVAQG